MPTMLRKVSSTVPQSPLAIVHQEAYLSLLVSRLLNREIHLLTQKILTTTPALNWLYFQQNTGDRFGLALSAIESQKLSGEAEKNPQHTKNLEKETLISTPQLIPSSDNFLLDCILINDCPPESWPLLVLYRCFEIKTQTALTDAYFGSSTWLNLASFGELGGFAAETAHAHLIKSPAPSLRLSCQLNSAQLSDLQSNHEIAVDYPLLVQLTIPAPGTHPMIWLTGQLFPQKIVLDILKTGEIETMEQPPKQLPIAIQLGSFNLSIEELLSLRPGASLDFEATSEELEGVLLVGDRPWARCQITQQAAGLQVRVVELYSERG